MSCTRYIDNIEIEETPVNDSQNKNADPFYESWIAQSSAPFSIPALFATQTLKELYPRHSVVQFEDSMDFFNFPELEIAIASLSDFVSCLTSASDSHPRKPAVSGPVRDKVELAHYDIKWNGDKFMLYSIKLGDHDCAPMRHYLLYEGPETRSRELFIAAVAWNQRTHENILVFDRQSWQNSHELWVEAQKANWDDVILKPQFKDALRNDIHGFFESEELYQGLALTWKRGIILLGPPGNGKTMTLKAVMKDCCDRGYTPIYVRSCENSAMCNEDSMGELFKKARAMAPSLIILEDLDSLVTDQNRSIFLNQLDGLENNDGLLVIGTTNHFERLDPALSGRPSRFDRKYAFEDPGEEERRLYAKYWQDKLRSNKALSFPDSLVSEIAASTGRFSFAYMKEAFISALVVLAGLKGDKPSFAIVLQDQIRILHEQLNHNFNDTSQYQ